MTRDRIIDRIRKLQALARSKEKCEAQSAKRRMAALKRRHRIRKEDLDELPEEDLVVDAGELGKDPYWRIQLAFCVGARHAAAVARKDRRVAFRGRMADRAARHYARLSAEVASACQRSWKKLAGGVPG